MNTPTTSAEPGAAPTAEKSKRHWFVQLLRDWVLPLAITAAVLTPLRSAIADWNDVPTGSMRPTILEGDRIFVNKLAFGLRVPFTHTWLATWGGPSRGDIVTLASPKNGERLVKRVIGLPGDRVSMHDHTLYINGEAQPQRVQAAGVTEPVEDRTIPADISTESLGTHTHALTLLNIHTGREDFPEITVPPDAYFVMGDNRDLSFDSRFFGVVKRDHIYGRASWIVLSLDRSNWYLPRFGRFFSTLP